MAGRGTETSRGDCQVGQGGLGRLLTNFFIADDDKIRLQLYLDVSYFMNQLGSDTLGDLSEVTGSRDGVMIKQVVEESVARFINELNL